MTKKASSKTGEKERAAATGRPTSATEDLTDHSVPASEIAKQVDPKGDSGATVNAKSMEAVGKKADADEIEENSLASRIRKSGLVFVRNHVTGQDYVGQSPQNDENASAAEKRLSSVSALDGVAPRTGMIVKAEDGEFTVGEGFGPEKTPADWAAVTNPATGKPLFG